MIRKKVKHIYFKSFIDNADIINTHNYFTSYSEFFTLLFNKIVDRNYPIRHIGIGFGNVKDELYQQYDLFANVEDIEKEQKLQSALVEIRNKYGKNSALKGMNLLDKATARYRNTTIGGHKA